MPRPRLLLLPLTLALALGPTASALAADVGVLDFEFLPRETKVAVGESVRWTFTDGGHTATASRGQPDFWDSGTKGAGETFEHRFDTPGRYGYVCRPHASFMKGVIEVGEDSRADTVDAFRTKRSGRTATVSFRLNEPATVTYALRGPTRRTVERGRLRAGRHSFRLRRLRPGAYRGTLTAVDDFDNRAAPKRSFVIR